MINAGGMGNVFESFQEFDIEKFFGGMNFGGMKTIFQKQDPEKIFEDIAMKVLDEQDANGDALLCPAEAKLPDSIFNFLDANGDDLISKQELKDKLGEMKDSISSLTDVARVLNQVPKPDELSQLMENMPGKGKSAMNFEELMQNFDSKATKQKE